MRPFQLFTLSFILLLTSDLDIASENWLVKRYKSHSLFYKKIDAKNIKEYERMIRKGMTSVNVFFNSSYPQRFNVYVHPGRNSLDSTWQHDWKIPGFKSECWMVASGTATRMDMISPKMWDKESCEHNFKEVVKTQRLITHELVHVYHGQVNESPDFSDVLRIDWFIEGLASYASGQCDSSVIKDIKIAITENKIPSSLDDFWTGRLRYGLSGSVVMYIDLKYGRAVLSRLLTFNEKNKLLDALNITESELLREWKNFVINL